MKKIESLYQRIIRAKFGWKLHSGSGEGRFLKISNIIFCFSHFCYYLRFDKDVAHHLNKLYPRMLCAKFRWNWPSACGEEFLKKKIFIIILHVRFYLPLELRVALQLIKLESSLPRMVCAKFCWNWSRDSGEEHFLNIFNWIIYFCYYLPLEKGVALQMNKLEPPLPKDDLGQVWSKLALCYWRRKLLNVCNRILHLCYYLHLEKGVALLLHKFESHLLKNDLCQVKFGLNWPSVTGKEDFWIFAIEFISPWKTV